MGDVVCGYYYWIRLTGADEDNLRIWEPAYRFRGKGHADVWLVIATAEDVTDDKVSDIGPRLEPPK